MVVFLNLRLLSKMEILVRVTQVNGHATGADVQQGKVREEDRFGNQEADASPAGPGYGCKAYSAQC